MYQYKAKVVSVYDGDTIRVNIDLGFGIIQKGNKGRGLSLRLHRINAPEMRGVEKKEGKKSRDFLREKILGKEIIVKTIKDNKGKYGRYLAEIFIDNENINDVLVKKGYAKYKQY